MPVVSYKNRVRALLSPSERQICSRLITPSKIQDYLDNLPINFEITAETYMSPRRVIEGKTAHCFEGALLAAVALAYHGKKPYLLDIQTNDGEDHVIALYQQNGLWGAISKTNHSTLRYRDALYKTVRELALSYVHEYIDDAGRKTMRAYSAPFDLSRFAPERWVTAPEELFWLVEKLDGARHFAIAPKKSMKLLRPASTLERHVLTLPEWSKDGDKIT